MNILTIGITSSVVKVLEILGSNGQDILVTHADDQLHAHELIENNDNDWDWDWVLIQGHDDPDHWKSILCKINAIASNTPITIVSSHIDGTRLKTPVCSMHNNGNGLSIGHCAMQNLLEEEKPAINSTTEPQESPIVFEYHSPCR